MNQREFLFSQSMLTMMCNSTASTISRLAAKLSLKSTEESGARRKYNFEESRMILSEMIAKDYDIDKKVQVFFNFKGGIMPPIYRLLILFCNFSKASSSNQPWRSHRSLIGLYKLLFEVDRKCL